MAKPHHREEYIYLAGLTHDSVIIAWGAFFFKKKGNGKFKLVDDEDLGDYNPGRKSSIGFGSESYGRATVEVFDRNGTRIAMGETSDNHYEVKELSPETTYTYRIIVDNKVWAGGSLNIFYEKRKRFLPDPSIYRNEFTTFPAPNRAAELNFAVIGDFGKRSEIQYRVAQAIEKAVDEYGLQLMLTTGDNIYRKHIFNPEGGEDDDWLLTYFQPYRHVINRIPVFPCIGNHDADESEDQDDRSQLYTNFYADQRFPDSIDGSIFPGLFYRFRYGSDIEFICLDTSKAKKSELPSGDNFRGRFYEHPKHRAFLENIMAETSGAKWRIPFSHHPPYSKGSDHDDTKEGLYELADEFHRFGVRAFFSGHSHTFQHFTRTQAAGQSHYFVSGGGGDPKSVDLSERSRGDLRHYGNRKEGHFLVVRIRNDEMEVIPIGEFRGSLRSISVRDENRQPFDMPITFTLN